MPISDPLSPNGNLNENPPLGPESAVVDSRASKRDSS